MTTEAHLTDGRALERALLFNLAIHAVAMLSMAALLAPFLPGGGSDGARIARIASHPWIFRLGWLPWHICALADIVLAVVLLRTAWIPRLPAIATLAFTLAAVVPDQAAQLLWITRGVARAREAVRAGDLALYLRFEGPNFQIGSGLAAVLYTLAAIGWTFCFAGTSLWTRALGRLSVVTWTAFAVVSPLPLLPASIRPPGTLIAAGNAVTFVLLEIWLGAVAERLLRRARPETRTGVHAPWRHPSRGLAGRACDALAGSRLLRALCARLPVTSFASDITDVVYVNYLVPAQRLAALVPPGLQLQRLGPGGAHALFTFLTYRHGHFGPRFLGPLRRLFPSPAQTNWRLYVRDPRSGREGVHFITNAISATPQALGARLMSEGMPMHVLARAAVTRASDGTIRVTLDPGAGSAPDATLVLRPCRAPSGALPPPWSACFDSWRAFLAYAVPQDRAMATQPWQGTISRQEIDLGIALDACEPLEGDVRSQAAQVIVGDGDAAPLCFRVPAVSFRFVSETREPLSPAA